VKPIKSDKQIAFLRCPKLLVIILSFFAV